MLEIAYTDEFLDDVSSLVLLDTKEDEIFDAIELISYVPVLGSRNLPKSIIRRFGDSVRKLVVSPFLVIYEIDEQENVVLILGLIPERSAI